MCIQRAATVKTQGARKDIVNAMKETFHVLINANANSVKMIKYFLLQTLIMNAIINIIK